MVLVSSFHIELGVKTGNSSQFFWHNFQKFTVKNNNNNNKQGRCWTNQSPTIRFVLNQENQGESPLTLHWLIFISFALFFFLRFSVNNLLHTPRTLVVIAVNPTESSSAVKARKRGGSVQKTSSFWLRTAVQGSSPQEQKVLRHSDSYYITTWFNAEDVMGPDLLFNIQQQVQHKNAAQRGVLSTP